MRCGRVQEDKSLPQMLKFTFERGGELHADFLSDAAPKTIERVLGFLPCESTAYHTRWCGREVYFPVKSLALIPKENQTSTASLGDVVYWKEWENQDNSPETLSLYYGAEVIRDHRGFLQVNVFARISQDQWPLIVTIGTRIWQKGIEKILIEVSDI
jgi:hypothetical protein